MAFDYKKAYKEFYVPPKKPHMITIPSMNFLAVRGQGDPNEEQGAYKESIALLYGMAYTIKMSKMGAKKLEGYFDFVVPPLEGLWWQEGIPGVDYAHKETFQWISLIRLPEFVTKDVFEWARDEVSQKKQIDCAKVEFFCYEEGLCVQCMHIGPYDEEPTTVQWMVQAAREQGYVPDFANGRYHHEIYLTDARRTRPENQKTVIRIPLYPVHMEK